MTDRRVKPGELERIMLGRTATTAARMVLAEFDVRHRPAPALQIPSNPQRWRPSADDDVLGPNGDGYHTAGIDIPIKDIFGKPDWHGHAVQFHCKDRDEAIRRRDTVMQALAQYDANDIWEAYIAETEPSARSPQGALAFAVDFIQSRKS